MQYLYTKEGETLTGIPWEDYPRPLMRRKEWISLNGEWEIKTQDGETHKIRVPFCPESILSGCGGKGFRSGALHYKRCFRLPEKWRKKLILLHFGAVSNKCEVFVNGKKVCEHDNGYLSFYADVTEEVLWDGEDNLLEVFAENDLSGRAPYGKQKVERGGMWYTPVSGIWQTVWLEPVPERYFTGLRIRSDLSGAEITAEGMSEGVIICEEREYRLQDGKVRIEPEKPKHWSPESPSLYEFTLKSGEDLVTSYFALRSLSVEMAGGIPRLCLNGKPYFFHGLLDQGYFSDGIYTPAVPDAFEKDILAMKALGFNMLRKHIKIEPERFYYDCDRIGMVVFQDMVNNGDYRFLRDTVFPTFGICNRSDERMHGDMETRNAFLKGMEGTVRQLYSHPCICCWTIFNEGWGQFGADRAYERLKALDETRFVDATSGWFHQKKSDFDSLHIYFEKLHLGKRRNLPQVLSEFGGYVYKIPEHSYNLEKTYGYKIFGDREKYARAVREVYLKEIVPLAEKGLCAAVFTQVSDVEDETNGILTFDRRVCKLKIGDMEGIADALQAAVTKK